MPTDNQNILDLIRVIAECEWSTGAMSHIPHFAPHVADNTRLAQTAWELICQKLGQPRTPFQHGRSIIVEGIND